MTTLESLVDRARELTDRHNRVVIGIAGSPGSGKTTLAECVVRLLRASPPDGIGSPDWVAHVPMDGFHLADNELVRLNRHDRKGAPETFDVDGYLALLRRIRADEDEVIYAPAFERDLEQPIAGSIPVSHLTKLIVTEGNYLLLDAPRWSRVRELLDETWFCEVDDEERVRRLIARHVLFGKTPQAAKSWVLGNDQRNADLVAATRVHADVVVPEETLDEANQYLARQ